MNDMTPEQEKALDDWLLSQEPPTMTAEEAEWENKAAAVEQFVQAVEALIDAIDELDALGIATDLEELRDRIAQAKYPFDPDFEDHNPEV